MPRTGTFHQLSWSPGERTTYLACLAPEAILSLLKELLLEFPSCPGVLLILSFFVHIITFTRPVYYVFGAVRLNGGSKRSSQSTSLKTLPAFTHDNGWFFKAVFRLFPRKTEGKRPWEEPWPSFVRVLCEGGNTSPGRVVDPPGGEV